MITFKAVVPVVYVVIVVGRKTPLLSCKVVKSRCLPISVAACIFLFIKLRDWKVLLNFAKNRRKYEHS